MPDTSVAPYMSLVCFKLLPWCRSSEGVSLRKSVCGFFKGKCLELQNFLPLTQSILVIASRGYGDLSSWHWNPGLGSWWRTGTHHSWDIPPEFLFTTCGCGTSLFCDYIPPTILDVCGFFNSVVFRLPFNLISDGSKWWLFYILVVILMWLCKDLSHVYLYCHLDQKSQFWKVVCF